ncbi:MAG: InlB B-repeat-containing protein [bacterium]
MMGILKKIFICMLLSLCFIITGCSSTHNDPLDALKEQYGSTEFDISFYSELLETPLNDMVYTALNMPILPTPTKTGYIFLGWYMDRDYTTSYYENILYLYMKDVTLYAKWQKEEFVSDGVYDIEISSTIVEGSVTKGELTDANGGFKDISDYFIEEECYIEKSGEQLNLRLQYDNEVTIPFAESIFPFNLSVDGRMLGEIKVDSSITALSEPIHTQYIDISDFDVANEMYFNITYKNYTSGLSSEDSAKTLTTYTIKIVIERIIGFSKNYQDKEIVLEDGYYQTRTTYKQTNYSDTMGQQFNPEFSYIIAEKGNYTLVKPFYPYAGLTSGSSSKDIKDIYFERLAAFSNSLLYYSVPSYSVDFEADPTEDFYPATVNAGKYGTFILEYNQETGLFYMIMDMGNSLDNYFVIPSAVTGFMENVSGMGHVDMLMIPDYDHIIKVNEINYTPIDGEKPFTYTEEFAYYPGSTDDFSNNNTIYNTTQEYGTSTDFYNFFYTEDNANGIKSFRLTSTPTISTSATNVSEQKGQVAYYDRKVEVYDFDVKKESLTADKMASQTFGYTGLRFTEEVRIGMSVNKNTQLKVDDLIKQFVDPNLSINNCTYSAYAITNNKVDFDTTIRVSSDIYFTQSMAILIEFNNCYSLIELMEYKDPTVNIVNTADNVYVENTKYSNGQSVYFPRVEYSYMGNEDKFWGQYYSNEEGVKSVNMIVFTYDQGLYTYSKQPGFESIAFTIDSAETYVIYEIENIYGEKYHHKLLFSSYSSAFYDIKDKNDNYIVNDAEYRLSSSTGNYSTSNQAISYNYTNLEDIINSEFTLDTRYHKDYFFPTSDVMSRTSIVISSDSKTVTLNGSNSLSSLESAYISNGFDKESYVKFTVKYYSNNVYLTVTYIKNVTFNGQDDPYLLAEDEYFINNTYEVDKPQLINSNGQLMDLGDITFEKIDGSKTTSQYICINYGWINIVEYKYHYEFTFLLEGTWQITYDYDEISYKQIIDVKSDSIEVVITYVLTDGYEFSDGTTRKEVSYALNETILTLGIGTTSAPTFDDYSLSNNYFSDGARLLGWSTYANQKFPSISGQFFSSNSAIKDFVNDFGSLTTTLYIVVDPGLNIHINYSYKDYNSDALFNYDKTFVYYTTSTSYNQYSASLSSYDDNTSDTGINNTLNGLKDKYGNVILDNYNFIEFTNYSGTKLSTIYTSSNNAYIYAKFGVNFKINYNVDGYNDIYAGFVSDSTFITSSINILEGDVVTDSATVINSKYNITMNSEYNNYIINYYAYFNGTSLTKFDLTTTKVTSLMDSYDGNVDYTIELYAVYVQNVTVSYNVNGYNNEYLGYSNSVITDSVNVRLGERVGEHMFSVGESSYVSSKNKITIVPSYSNYNFIGWAYYNGSKLVIINLETTNITSSMVSDNSLTLYAVYAQNGKVEFKAGNISLTSTIYYGYTLAAHLSTTDYNIVKNYETNNNISWAYWDGAKYIEIDLSTTIITEDMDIDNDGVINFVAIPN